MVFFLIGYSSARGERHIIKQLIKVINKSFYGIFVV